MTQKAAVPHLRHKFIVLLILFYLAIQIPISAGIVELCDKMPDSIAKNITEHSILLNGNSNGVIMLTYLDLQSPIANDAINYLNELSNKFKESDVQIIAFSLDEAIPPQSLPMDFAFITDTGGDMFDVLGRPHRSNTVFSYIFFEGSLIWSGFALNYADIVLQRVINKELTLDDISRNAKFLFASIPAYWDWTYFKKLSFRDFLQLYEDEFEISNDISKAFFIGLIQTLIDIHDHRNLPAIMEHWKELARRNELDPVSIIEETHKWLALPKSHNMKDLAMDRKRYVRWRSSFVWLRLIKSIQTLSCGFYKSNQPNLSEILAHYIKNDIPHPSAESYSSTVCEKLDHNPRVLTYVGGLYYRRILHGM